MASAIGTGAIPDTRASLLAFDTAMTPCMPCTFSALQTPRSEAIIQLSDSPGLTVVVRWIPLVTAAYGTRVARPVSTTMLGPGGNGSQLAQTVRRVWCALPSGRTQDQGCRADALNLGGDTAHEYRLHESGELRGPGNEPALLRPEPDREGEHLTRLAGTEAARLE
jgi:hypothetical protein